MARMSLRGFCSARLHALRVALLLCTALSGMLSGHSALAQNVKVAFIGDQGWGEDARRVLELIRDEGTELLVLQGDLGYDSDAADAWIDNVDSILGDNFPVLLVVGNHENHEWPRYRQWQTDRLSTMGDMQCEGTVSVKAYCTYKHLGIVLVAPGIFEVEGINGEDDYASYITDRLQNDNSTWRICNWHKNMRDMQVGSKGDTTGWPVYQNCLAQGGIVLNGHAHSYSRTHLLSSFQDKTIINTSNDMQIGPNSSITIVSGLGGRSVRTQQHGGDWFGSVYTSDQGASSGSLFCTFGDTTADCYFKDIAGLVPDTFRLTSLLASDSSEAVSADLSEQETIAEQETTEPPVLPVQSGNTEPTEAPPTLPQQPQTVGASIEGASTAEDIADASFSDDSTSDDDATSAVQPGNQADSMPATEPATETGSSGGGALGWPVLLLAMLGLRRRPALSSITRLRLS